MIGNRFMVCDVLGLWNIEQNGSLVHSAADDLLKR